MASDYKDLRGNAGGMTLSKADTEGVDNSFDAGAMKHIMALLRHKDDQYLIHANDGPGLHQMPHLYGVADKMPPKTESTTAGMFNLGHLAQVAYFDPVSAYSESAIDSSTTALQFDTQDFVEAYEAAITDLASVKVSEHMSVARDRTVKMQNLLQELVSRIPDSAEDVKNLLSAIYARTAPNYMLHVFKLRADQPITAELLRNIFNGRRKTYWRALTALGKTLAAFIDDDKTDEEGSPRKYLRIDASVAVDPLHDREKFPVLSAPLEFRKHATDGTLARIGVGSHEYFISPKKDKRCKVPRKLVVLSETEPKSWREATPLAGGTFEMNSLDEAAAEEQRRLLGIKKPGSDLQSVEDLRGIETMLAHRILGNAYWPSNPGPDHLGFGHRRNVHEPRGLLSIVGYCDDEFTIKDSDCDTEALTKRNAQRKAHLRDLLKLHSNKHNNNLDEADPVFRFCLAFLYGTLVKAYSEKHVSGRTTPWNVDEFVEHALNLWTDKGAKPKAPIEPVTVPVHTLPPKATQSAKPTKKTTAAAAVEEHVPRNTIRTLPAAMPLLPSSPKDSDAPVPLLQPAGGAGDTESSGVKAAVETKKVPVKPAPVLQPAGPENAASKVAAEAKKAPAKTALQPAGGAGHTPEKEAAEVAEAKAKVEVKAPPVKHVESVTGADLASDYQMTINDTKTKITICHRGKVTSYENRNLPLYGADLWTYMNHVNDKMGDDGMKGLLCLLMPL